MALLRGVCFSRGLRSKGFALLGWDLWMGSLWEALKGTRA